MSWWRSPPSPFDCAKDSWRRTTATAPIAIGSASRPKSSRSSPCLSNGPGSRSNGFAIWRSGGHEGNAVLGRLTVPTDPSLLHYRSGAFYLERARHVPGSDPVMDLLLSLTASSEDPISGGRHKVFGSVSLGIPPQTSTIASHLPK